MKTMIHYKSFASHSFRLLLILALLTSASSGLYAQVKVGKVGKKATAKDKPAKADAGKDKEKKELKRPGKVGDSNVDNFVNQSFDIYEGTMKTEKDLAQIDSSMTKLEGEGKLTKEGPTLAKKLYAIQGETRKRQDKIKTLGSKSKSVLEGAKSISPKTKSLKAIKNVNLAIKALDQSKELTPKQVSKSSTLIGRVKKQD